MSLRTFKKPAVLITLFIGIIILFIYKQEVSDFLWIRHSDPNERFEVNLINDRISSRIETLIDSRLSDSAIIGSKIDDHIDRRIDTFVKSNVDNQIDERIDSKISSKIGDKIDSVVDERVDMNIDSKIDTALDTRIDERIDSWNDRRITNDSNNPLSVLWYTTLEGRAEESSGFIQESLNFIIPLYTTMEFGWYAGGTLSDLKLHKLFREFSKHDQGILEALFVKGTQIDHDLPHKDNVITIVFERPYGYPDIFDHKRMKHSLYKIGRAMFETDWIPNAWDYLINEYLDELWVPSEFAKGVFQRAGVYIPITVIGEGFNPEVFKAVLTEDQIDTNRRKFYKNCQSSDVVFLSVGKMDKRKGIDILITTWLKTFKAADPACLYIRAEMTEANKRTFQNKGLRIYQMPRLSNEDLVLAYKSADVFVLPSHGEGWGRPIMEAMAAGIPAIVPLWSGITEFVKEEYSIPLHVTSLEEAFKGQEWFINGKKYQKLHHWASINTKELGTLLKWCTNNQDQLPVIGAKGREAMYADYTWDAISSDVRNRIQEISVEMQEHGVEYYRRKNKRKISVREDEANKKIESEKSKKG